VFALLMVAETVVRIVPPVLISNLFATISR